jgi:prepilin-type N-terminal cleavage/methylation domain-containing protein
MKHAQFRAGSVSDRRKARELTPGACATRLAEPVTNAPGSEGRPAFTLVEMLIVVTIMLIITVAVVAVAPRFTDDRKLTRAADQIAQIFLTAKQRALRDQIPTGVRLLIDQQRSNLSATTPLILGTEMQYIQQPDDFKGGRIGLTTVQLPPAITGTPFMEYVLAAVPDPSSPVDFTGGFSDPTLWPVQAGDFLEVKGEGLVHRILQVIPGSPAFLWLAPAAPDQPNSAPAPPPNPPNTVAIANANQVAVGMFVQSSVGVTTITGINYYNTTTNSATITLAQPASGYLTFLPPPPPNASGLPVVYASPTAEYRVIRAPRVLVGETPLQLPAGICIDATSPKFPGDTVPAPPRDIMFSPQGGVLNPSGDAIILWVRDYTKDLSPQANAGQAGNTYPLSTWPPGGAPGDQFLILIQTHTGFIAEHPVNLSPGSDPYLFTRDARSSGM